MSQTITPYQELIEVSDQSEDTMEYEDSEPAQSLPSYQVVKPVRSVPLMLCQPMSLESFQSDIPAIKNQLAPHLSAKSLASVSILIDFARESGSNDQMRTDIMALILTEEFVLPNLYLIATSPYFIGAIPSDLLPSLDKILSYNTSRLAFIALDQTDRSNPVFVLVKIDGSDIQTKTFHFSCKRRGLVILYESGWNISTNKYDTFVCIELDLIRQSYNVCTFC